MSDNESEPCVICNKVNKIKAKRCICSRCDKIYHSTCSKLMIVLVDKEKKLVCGPCLSEVNSSSLPAPRTGSTNTASRSSLNSNTTLLSREEAGEDATLTMILQQLKKLDGLVESNKATDKKIDDLTANFDNQFQELNSRISVLDQLPGLFERVTANEQKIAEITEEQKAIRTLVEQSVSGASASSDGGKLSQLEVDLNRKINRLTNKQAQLTQDVIISGLPHPDGTDLRLLSLAVLKAVYSEIQQRDIVSVRALVSKKAESVDGTPSRPSPIIVSLISPALVKAIIHGKIRLGKLHSTMLETDLVKSAGLSDTFSNLINISEFLPRELHQLRSLVWQKAKEKNFKTFLRNGEIHARWREGDKSYVISSKEDLDCFLELA